MFKSEYYLPHNDTLGVPESHLQIVNHLVNEYVYKNRCLYII